MLLEVISLSYAFLPSFIFLLGWLKIYFAIPLCLILSCGLWLTFRDMKRHAEDTPDDGATPARWIPLLKHCVIALLVIGVMLPLGVGHGFKNDDFDKHNAFLRDLGEGSLPVAYNETGPDNHPRMLNAYMGYYLVPAVVEKMAGWSVAYHFTFLWAALGVYLAILWFLRILQRLSIRYATLFLLFGGLDIFGYMIIHGWLVDGAYRLDFWTYDYAQHTTAGKKMMQGVFWIYSSHLSILNDAQHHVLPAWISLLMIFYYTLRKRTTASAVLLFATIPLCSAFVALGSAPLLGMAMLMNAPKSSISFQNLVVAPLLLLVTALYLTSNNGSFTQGFLWEFQDLLRTWPTLLLCYAVEFGLYALLCPKLPRTAEYRPLIVLYWTALVCLMVFPLYRMGQFNDFPTKGLIPPLLVLLLYMAMAISHADTPETLKRARLLVAFLCIGALTPLTQITFQLSRSSVQLSTIPLSKVPHINELEPKETALQLFSDGDSFFWRHLAKKPIYR